MSTLLLIDDEPQMGSLVTMCLEDPADRVVQATTAQEAREAAHSEDDFRLILLDLSLPDEDGLSLLPELRREPALSGVPILVFSVHDSRREEALAMGADGFVAKPFRTRTLREVLRSHLR